MKGSDVFEEGMAESFECGVSFVFFSFEEIGEEISAVSSEGF